MAVVVLGGCVLDIQAHPTGADDLQRGSSVPGQVVQLPGGVGRNIAEAAHHLLQQQQRSQQATAAGGTGDRASCLLISVVGQDTAADALLASFQHTGMSTRGLIRSPSASTPCVVALLDRGGEVAASVADVAAPAVELTPRVVQRHAADIAAAQLLVLDANLPASTLAAAVQVAANAGVPVLFEPVSVPKAPRCASFLHGLAAITPNANELLAIANAVQQQHGRLPLLPHAGGGSGGSLDGSSNSSGGGGGDVEPTPQQLLAQLAPAAAVVLQQGLSCIVLTMGSMGAALLTLSHRQQQQRQQPQHSRLQPQIQQHSSLSPAAQALLQIQLPNRNSGVGAVAATSNSHQSSSSSSGVAAAAVAGRLTVRAQHIPAAAATVVNLSGAGDTLVGGFAAALVRGADPLHALALGVAAARVSVQSKLNVPSPQEGLVYAQVEQLGQQLLSKQQTWEFPVQSAL